MKAFNCLTIACLFALGMMTTGCNPPPPQDEDDFGEVVKSEKGRNTAPVVDQANADELSDGNGAFAFDLYQSLRTEDGDLFYSPYSISIALAMAYAGAQGQTAEEMADTLRFTLPADRLHPAFNALDLELESRGEGAAGVDGGVFRLNIANAMWGQRDFQFLDEFLDTLAENYGAGMRLLDFITDPEGSRVTINDWVSDRTEERIQNLIPEGAISTMTRLVLTNAVYFNAAWLRPFEEDDTRDETFHLLDGGETTVKMMSQVESFAYGEGADYKAVELPYDGGELSMVIMLPAEGTFDTFEASLDADRLDDILAGLTRHQVTLKLPRFEYESEFSLAGRLAAMGMPSAFCGSSVTDFSGIDGIVGNLCISGVLHKAFVKVNEAGTEAAAATAVIFDATAAPDPDVAEFIADRPFIFLIRDIETRTILFIGRVLEPAE
jgi:serpin B